MNMTTGRGWANNTKFHTVEIEHYESVSAPLAWCIAVFGATAQKGLCEAGHRWYLHDRKFWFSHTLDRARFVQE